MKIQQNPSPKEVRRFTLRWMGVSAFLGVLLYYRHHPSAAQGVWSASLTEGYLGTLVPPIGRNFYDAWMTVSEKINLFITQSLLFFIFCFVFTPTAFLFKIFKRDALKLIKPKDAASYWKEHERILDSTYYKHLY
jgi:hypothetical protein